jgi:hypothetical protein
VQRASTGVSVLLQNAPLAVTHVQGIGPAFEALLPCSALRWPIHSSTPYLFSKSTARDTPLHSAARACLQTAAESAFTA